MNSDPLRPTIGFLCTWHIYFGVTIGFFEHALLRGVCAAARERDCNLLLSCGLEFPPSFRFSWSMPSPGRDFLPVGPWNTDGLIVMPDDLAPEQAAYLRGLIDSGFPIMLAAPEIPGPLVGIDNAGGIHQAVQHLVQHGHKRIAFLAGKAGHRGDSLERLLAYRAALREAGLEVDERLIAFGEHYPPGGRLAMQQILASGAPFTALLASNDHSCLGAMQVLREAGRRIPDDVAVIGFDDVLAARAQQPPLTTVRHPAFELGFQAVQALLDQIAGKQRGPAPNNLNREPAHSRITTRLIIRQSCGCRPISPNARWAAIPATLTNLEMIQTVLARAMAEAMLVEARYSRRAEIETQCLALVRAFTVALAEKEAAGFDVVLTQFFGWLERRQEDIELLQAALTTLRSGLVNLQAALPELAMTSAETLIDQAQLTVKKEAQRQAAAIVVQQNDMYYCLGRMTSQLLATFSVAESGQILAQHLPELGVDHAVVVIYAPDGDDPCGQGTVLLQAGLTPNAVAHQFPTREFPPPGLYPAEAAFQLALLPLVMDDQAVGFVAFSAANLEPLSAIVYNLASALRASRLYLEAVEGRQLAEESNRIQRRFLSTVSHELRTPLSLIVGLSDLLLQEQPGPLQLPEASRQDIEQINLNAQHLGRLINDVLDLASSDAGQLRLLREPLDLLEMLRTITPIGERLAQEKGLRWRAVLPEQSVWVLGDRTRLRQVMLNLISNAVKFTSSGWIAVALEVNERQAVVKVSDTGIGISAEEQAKLFREFYQAEQTVRLGYGGLGLGLAISKQLVEGHGGVMGVRSPGELGSGATFFFTLPVLPAAKVVSQPELAFGAGDIIVMTEHAEPGLVAHLLNRGFHVRWVKVEPGSDWLTRLLAAPPAALVLNQDTATRYGWELLERLKRQPPTETFPVLIYALDTEHDRGEWLELNYLEKPLAVDQLREQLTRLGDRWDASATPRVVLVVDDNPGVLDLHCRLVEQAGCRAVAARHGREALEILTHTRPDLILLDLMMPELDGFAVLDALHADPQLREIPVIILTARVLNEADIERLNRGVAAVMSKGVFSAGEMLERIEAVLARHRAAGGAMPRLVRRAMGYIHAHYAESLAREQIASRVGISAGYLAEAFRQELGIAPMVYLNRYRIRQACDLLENSDLKITQIALAVGFSDNPHFTHTFQRQMGMTPRAYRRRRRERPPTAGTG